MTTPADGTQGTEPQPSTGDSQPPYYEQLSKLPENVRPLVEPVFKEWDSNVNKRFQDIHSEYEPWKDISDVYDVDAVRQALAVAVAIEQDPEAVYKALGEAYNLSSQPEPQVEEEMPDISGQDAEGILNLAQDPRFKQHEEMLISMAELMLQQQQTTQEEMEDAQLEIMLTDLRGKYGDFDENYVLTMLANGSDPEQAVKAYQSAIEAGISARQRPQAPKVLGSGGGVPSNSVDPTTLDDKQTKDLVVQLLKASRQP